MDIPISTRMTESIESDLAAAANVVRQALLPASPEVENALAEMETFCAIALRVMRKTNPSKLRDAARTVEVEAYLKGREVVRG